MTDHDLALTILRALDAMGVTLRRSPVMAS